MYIVYTAGRICMILHVDTHDIAVCFINFELKWYDYTIIITNNTSKHIALSKQEKKENVQQCYTKAFHLTCFACITHSPCIEYLRRTSLSSSVKLASKVAAPATPIQAAAPWYRSCDKAVPRAGLPAQSRTADHSWFCKGFELPWFTEGLKWFKNTNPIVEVDRVRLDGIASMLLTLHWSSAQRF